MPELPEVETVMHGLKPHVEGAVINDVVVRYHQLRWPIPSTLHRDLCEVSAADWFIADLSEIFK